MAAAFDIAILWTVFKDIGTFLKEQTDKNKENVINAHKDINTAFIKTYDYLKNNNGKYIPNTELAEVWNQASASILRVDKRLGETLYNKSRFWLNPELYINLNRDSEIIELNQVVDEMERLRIKL
ncbi:hypothetical protein [Flavobacterium sp. N502540]|uniref:hypothetical protein n=1 Tax=Flavobacterium sp. N502540 TaxID=2986838 RepID=UPI00222493A6|nr:hypothetical protein [Flavobacterium sp. N502540]